MEDKLETLNRYWRYLYGRGEVTTRKELAERVGVSEHTICQAFAGGRYLSNKLLPRIVQAFPSLRAIEAQGPGDTVTLPTEEYRSLLRTLENLSAAVAKYAAQE